MRRSLQWRLSLTLAWTIIGVGLVATVASYRYAHSEAEEFQDDTLRQFAALIASSPRADGGAADAGVVEPVSRVFVYRLDSDSRPTWLPANLTPGFHTLRAPPERMRVFVRQGEAGTVAVAQTTDARTEIEAHSAARTIVPLLVVLPLLIVLSSVIVRSKLRSVQRLAQELDAQSAARLHTLPDAEVPTEVQAFVQAINRLLERVQRLLGEQERFIADAAHELRSPLSALSLQAQNLDNATTLADVAQRLQPLHAGIRRARRLTEQLLSHARIQANTGTREKVDFAALLRGAIAELEPLTEARRIELVLDSAPRLLLRGQPEVLYAIVKNALDNALRYTPAGGHVLLRASEDADDAVLEVVDQGPGLAPDDYERVFAPFYRGAASGGEGSGLGLAIARDAATRLGGTVSLHPGPDGCGLIFRYRQPREV